ncbi:MAG: Uma2 family endonuclease, partial [Hyphomonadaceae bacterium]|nr:Uma2 family endonuclease [Hyphomonadaceae bacterium]
VDPDVLVMRRTKIDRRFLQASEVLLAVEVADSSLAFDLGSKAGLYAAAGVPELWVLDLNGQETWLHRTPADGAYTAITRQGFDAPLTPLCDPQVAIRVAGLLD